MLVNNSSVNTASLNSQVAGTSQITQKFETDLAKAKKDLLISKIGLAAIILLATLFAAGAAIVLMPFAAMPLAFLPLTFSSLGTSMWALHHGIFNMGNKKEALQNLFTQLLVSGNGKLTKAKLELFKKHGHLCLVIDLLKVGNKLNDKLQKELALGIKLKNFFEWMDKRTTDPQIKNIIVRYNTPAHANKLRSWLTLYALKSSLQIRPINAADAQSIDDGVKCEVEKKETEILWSREG